MVHQQEKNMIKSLAAALFCLSVTLSAIANDANNVSTNIALPQVNEFLDSLSTQSQIPVLIPTASALSEKGYSFKYAKTDVQKINNQGYWVNFNWTPNCQGAPVCSQGYIMGFRISQDNTSQHFIMHPIPYSAIRAIDLNQSAPVVKGETKVTLTGNIPAYIFTPDPSQPSRLPWNFISWVSHHAFYQLALKNGSNEELIRMANDMLSQSKKAAI